MVTDRDREKPKQPQLIKAKASEMLACLVREHYETRQTRKIINIRTKKTKKPTGVLKNVMQDQRGCKNIRTEEEQSNACCTGETTRRRGRRYRHKAGGDGKMREQRGKHGKRTKQASKTRSVIATAFALPSLNSTKTKTTTHCRVHGYSGTRSTY